MIGRKITAVAMSAVLAVSLCPGLAMADSLEAGQAASPKTLTPQAKKSVYVLDTAGYTYSSTSYKDVYEPAEHGDYKYDAEDDYYYSVGDEDGDGYNDGDYNYVGEVSVPTTTTRAYKYSYKNGLVTKVSEDYSYTGSGNNDYSSSSTRATLKYKGKNLTKITNSGTTYKIKSKNGHVQSASYSDKWSSGYEKSNSTYTWNGSKCTKVKNTRTYKYSGQKKRTSTYTTKYSSFKKGVPTKQQSSYKSSDGSSSTYAPYKYTLDSKGNVKKTKSGSYSATTIKLTYKNGRVVTKNVGGSTYTFTYKKVSTSAPSVTKAQQWSLINGDSNCAFGPVSLGI